MPRVRERKTSRGQVDLSKYKVAYDEVKGGVSLRKAAVKHAVNHCSLLRYIRKRDASGGEENFDMGYKAHNRVFNEEQEQEFCKYLIKCADIFNLSKKDVRKLAYGLTFKYNLPRPPTWDHNKMAGEEWFHMFMKRNQELAKVISIGDISSPVNETLQLIPRIISATTETFILPSRGESHQQILFEPSTSTQPISLLIHQSENVASSSGLHKFSPKAVRPLRKATPRKLNKGRQIMKTDNLP